VDAGEDREYSRQPRPEDLTKICDALNREGAHYILIGGFAVIARGLERPTKDIDLMSKACGVSWEDAARDSEVLELDGVEIPIAGIETLIRTKQTVRPHDAADREFLERLLRP